MTNSAITALENARVSAAREVVSAEKALAEAERAVVFAKQILSNREETEIEITSALKLLEAVYIREEPAREEAT